MRKFLTLFSALLLTVSMWGQVARTYTMKTISNVEVISNLDINGFTITFEVDGTYSSTKTGYFNVTLNLQNAEDIEGEFTLNAETNKLVQATTTIVEGTTTRYAVSSATYPTILTITHLNGDLYHISGTWDAAKSKTSTTPYRYKFDNDFRVGPYADEPDAGSFTFNGTNITNMTPAQASNIVLDFGKTNSYETLELQFNGMNQIAAGEYSVAATGANGTIQASIGYDESAYYPYPSSYVSSNPDYYYITGGSVTVSYSDDQQAMTVTGTLTTAHGSTISVNCIGVNPWAPIINADITVSNVTATMNANGYLNIEMTGTPNNMAIAGTCTSITDLTVANLNATNTYVTLVGDATSDINKNAVENSLSIVATGNTEEYKLNATIVCKNGNTYNVKDVIFTCHIPTAWDDEEETDDFTFTAGTLTGIDDMIASKGYVVFNFTQGYEEAKIAIATDSKQLAAGDYSIIASAGKSGSTYSPTYAPSVVLKGSWADQPYFLMDGNVTLAYSQDLKTLTLTGTATSYRGTTVTLNLSGTNPDAPKEATFDVLSTTVSIGAAALSIDVQGKKGTTPKEAILYIVGQNTPIFGSYELADFDDMSSYIWVSGYNYASLSGASTSATIEQKEGSTYTLNATLVCDDGYTYYINDAEFTYSMAVSEAADQTALLNRAMNATIDLTIQRAFVDGMWQTISLPFDIADIDASPLAGAVVKSVTNCSLEGETLLVEAEDVTSMTAGMPYLIMWESGAPTNPVFESVTIKTTEGATSGNFVANLNAKHIEDITGKYMVVAENGLAPMGTGGSVNGFRAYFQLNVPAGVAPRKFAFAKNTATGLIRHDAQAIKATKTIKNGRLLIMKGGRMYNAQAQEMK